MPLLFNPNSPICLQVMTVIKTDISTGTLKPGEKLPGGRDLAMTYSINPNTAARVYQELEKENLCGTRRGMGTFVTEDAERITRLREELTREATCQFLEQMKNLGFSPREAAEIIIKEAERNA